PLQRAREDRREAEPPEPLSEPSRLRLALRVQRNVGYTRVLARDGPCRPAVPRQVNDREWGRYSHRCPGTSKGKAGARCVLGTPVAEVLSLERVPEKRESPLLRDSRTLACRGSRISADSRNRELRRLPRRDGQGELKDRAAWLVRARPEASVVG